MCRTTFRIITILALRSVPLVASPESLPKHSKQTYFDQLFHKIIIKVSFWWHHRSHFYTQESTKNPWFPGFRPQTNWGSSLAFRVHFKDFGFHTILPFRPFSFSPLPSTPLPSPSLSFSSNHLNSPPLTLEVDPLNPARGLGSRVSGVWSRASAESAFWCILALKSDIRWQQF